MKNGSSTLRLWGAVFVASIGVTSAGRASAQVRFTADFMSADQPRVLWVLEDPENPGEEGAVGPVDYFPYAVLDTGANGIVIGGVGYLDDLLQADYERYGRATRPDTGEYIYFAEIGVSGPQTLDVLTPYHLNIGSKSSAATGVPAFAINNAVILGAVLRDAGGNGTDTADFGSFSAIIGMPAMAGRVTEIDLRVTAGGDGSDGVPAFDLLMAEFHTQLPQATANSLHVNLTPLILPPNPGGLEPGDPHPTYADVPLLGVTSKRVLGGATLSTTKQFLLDTGAQTTIISTNIASSLNYNLDPDDPNSDIVDFNGDGKIDHEDYVEVGGLGGSSFMPLVVVDELVIGTVEGVDIIAEQVVVGVLDIGGEGDDSLLDGVLGMNILGSGYTNLIFAGTGEYGRFTHVYFDFTEEGDWKMRLEVNPDFVDATPEPASMGLVFVSALGLLQRRRRRGL